MRQSSYCRMAAINRRPAPAAARPTRPPLQPMRSLADLAQRGVVTALFGLSVYGLYVAYDVHTLILKRGQEVITRREAVGLPTDGKKKKLEYEIAQQAQLATPTPIPPTASSESG
ncbi:hypothetical protein FRC02_010069 [Tulasnella sp. 418]|nr:hypothetical protein FRC02_010069 [Tulasnella sp. 418]